MGDLLPVILKELAEAHEQDREVRIVVTSSAVPGSILTFYDELLIHPDDEQRLIDEARPYWQYMTTRPALLTELCGVPVSYDV